MDSSKKLVALFTVSAVAVGAYTASAAWNEKKYKGMVYDDGIYCSDDDRNGYCDSDGTAVVNRHGSLSSYTREAENGEWIVYKKQGDNLKPKSSKLVKNKFGTKITGGKGGLGAIFKGSGG